MCLTDLSTETGTAMRFLKFCEKPCLRKLAGALLKLNRLPRFATHCMRKI